MWARGRLRRGRWSGRWFGSGAGAHDGAVDDVHTPGDVVHRAERVGDRVAEASVGEHAVVDPGGGPLDDEEVVARGEVGLVDHAGGHSRDASVDEWRGHARLAHALNPEGCGSSAVVSHATSCEAAVVALIPQPLLPPVIRQEKGGLRSARWERRKRRA